MKKGDEKKQEILNIADRLFCTKGFEMTSIQDILDLAHTSKGGFYHHFASKDAVLDVLCSQRAEKAACAAEEALEAVREPMKRINTLFYYMLPFRRDEQSFITMLLPLLEKPESLAVRVRYQEALMRAFEQPLVRELLSAQREGVIYPPVRDASVPVLMLVNQCWLEAALHVASSARTAQRPDPAALLTTLEKYRRSIEVLLDAPYGSVQLIALGEWGQMVEGMARSLHVETGL